jgi:broad specificity phosphatase PhoE
MMTFTSNLDDDIRAHASSPDHHREATSLTRFHLVRHATYGQLRRILTGRTPGHGLNQAGQAEAEALAEDCAPLPLAAIVASPMERAQETAIPIAARHGLDIRTDPGIDEIDFGEWRGQEYTILHQREDIQAWNRSRALATIPGGEPALHVQARALASIHRLAVEFPDAELLLVSHADVIKSILAAVLGMPLDFILRLEIAPASRSVIDFSTSGRGKVIAVNLPPPNLRPPNLPPPRPLV